MEKEKQQFAKEPRSDSNSDPIGTGPNQSEKTVSHSGSFQNHSNHPFEEQKIQNTMETGKKNPGDGLIGQMVTGNSDLDQFDLAESLKELLTSGKIDCAICYCKIKPEARLWNCRRCYGPFHLHCIKQWITNNPINKEELAKQEGPLEWYVWTCPKCNFCYSEEMPVYTCFCEKVQDPQPESYSTPHSCGDVCEKQRGESCVHPCNLQCHPGPCPPCNLLGKTKNCYCGKKMIQVKCSDQSGGFTCGNTCDKTLSCNNHKCGLECHEGSCPPCDKTYMKACDCGQEQKVQKCGIERFSCNKTCGKPLNCGNHKCTQLCHEGPCKPCLYTPDKLKTCLCKNRLPLSALGFGNRKSCLDPIPSCGLPCGKKLECGHMCKAMCHAGDCDDCVEVISQNCRCGNSSRKIKCHLARHGKPEERVFTCERVCKKLKGCGVHKCNTACCNATKGDDPDCRHLCVITCDKPLACKNHKCDLFCHLGGCPPCQVIINQPLTCQCGAAVKYPPLRCGTARPSCSLPCSRPRPCGHACPMNCHSDASCPPCHELVEKLCECGRSKIQNVKCCKEVSCGKPCDKLFDCGHECGVVCHKGECDGNKGKAGCGKRCGKLRACGHPCAANCHPGVPCPEDIKCKFETRKACACGNRKISLPCSEAMEKSVECDQSCAIAQRYKQFLARGASRKDYYPANIISIAKTDVGFLLKLEAFVDSFLREGKNSASFPIPERTNPKNLLVQVLLTRHYKLDAQFHFLCAKPAVTVLWTDKTAIPKVKMSEYLKKIDKKEIDPDVLPFEASLRFMNLTKMDRIEELVIIFVIFSYF